jgi:hypothetical protein
VIPLSGAHCIGESSEDKERFKGCIQIIPKFLIYIIFV